MISLKKSEYLKQWRENNPNYKAPGVIQSKLKYRNSAKGKAKELAYRTAYKNIKKELDQIRKSDPEYVTKQREWQKKHSQKPEIMARKRELHKIWSKKPEYILKRRLRSCLGKALSLYSDKGKILSSRSYDVDYQKCIKHLEREAEILGYSIMELKDKNYQIDHIIPCSLYNLNNKTEVARCWNPSNLRWLHAKENIIKGNRLRHEDLKIIKTLPKEIYPKSWNGKILTGDNKYE